jgi:hypothetical protein
MNRYDTISTSAYAPRSLQETLLVPSMRRAQHDAADKNLQTQLSELDKVNPLDKHYGEAQRIKSELSKTIGSQAESLATQGFNNNTTSDIYRTNRTIGDLYSPTGTLGQINAAKLAYDKDSDEYLKSATAMGHSPERVKLNLKEIQDKYNSEPVYGKNGKVSSMSIDKLPPKYVDYQDKAMKLFKDANLNSADIDNLASDIVLNDDGSSYVLSKGSKSSKASNAKGIQAALNFLNTEILNPNSDTGKSLNYSKINPTDALKDVLGLSGVYKVSKSASGSTSQISNYNPAPVQDGSDGYGLTESANTFVSDKFSGMSYSELGDVVAQYKNDKTPAGRQKYYEANTFKNKLDSATSNVPEIKKLKDQLAQEEKRFLVIQSNPNKQYINGKLVDSGYKTEQSKNAFVQNQNSKYIQRINTIKNQIGDLSKPYIGQTNSESTDYMLTPYTTKQSSLLKIADENIQKLFQTSPENIKSMVNIETIGTSEGNVLNNVSSADRETIAKVLSRAKPGDITLNRVSGKGTSGKPEYVLRIVPNDESEKLYGNNKFWSKSKINKEPIDVRVSFNKMKGNSGVDLVNGLITQYVQGAGGKGKQLAQTMTAYATYGDKSWNDYKSDPTVIGRIDNIIENMVIEDNSSPYGKLTTSQARARYLKHHGNETINFHDN